MAKPRRVQKPKKRDVALHKPFKVMTELLLFDTDNPRFSGDSPSPKKDAEIVAELGESADIAELLQSIASNGYIDIEPLIVMPKGQKFVVLEGNRRLAAIRLLTEPSLREETGISVPPMDKSLLKSLREVTVYAVAKRDEARDFIGFKHINGPHRWDALAKARFAADWYKSERASGVTLPDIAQRLGDRHDTVKRLVNGVFVLDQAKKERVFDVADRSPGRAFAFSHLYTALTRPGFQEFLGLPDSWRSSDPVVNPVPEDRLDNLKRVLVWLYGSKQDDVQPVITSQNPHIKQLDEVLQKPIARRTMLARNRLAEAYKLVYTPAVQFENALLNANQNAEDALAKISGYDGGDESLLEAASTLMRTSQAIFDLMQRQHKTSGE
jgi:hypothetical protein